MKKMFGVAEEEGKQVLLLIKLFDQGGQSKNPGFSLQFLLCKIPALHHPGSLNVSDRGSLKLVYGLALLN